MTRAANARAAQLADRGERDDRQAEQRRRPAVDQADLRAQAREREEQRQQQHRTESLQTIAQARAEFVAGRQRHAGDERAEQARESPMSSVVSADANARPTRHGEVLLAEGIPSGRGPKTGQSIGRTTNIITATNATVIPTSQRHASQRSAGGDDRHDERQQDPRGDVVHGRARERHGADGRVGQVAFGQDARQHRKRRDAHGNAHEQGKRVKRNPSRGVVPVEHQRREARQARTEPRC